MSILSVDLGHGETAAAYIEYGMKNGKPTQAVKRLNFEDKSFTVYSRIFITEEQMSALSQMSELSYDNLSGLGGFLIGNFSKQINKSGYIYNYFKIQPSKFDEPFEDTLSIKYGITHGMVMACFAYEVIDQVLKSNPEIENFTRQNTTLLVGCPTSSKWTRSDFQKNYRELVSLATGMEQVVIIPESRAAMFSTVVGGEGSAISADLGALVFDFGSSTADCTYMWMGKKLWEFSWKLGASAIEENLYDSVVEEYNQSVSDNDRIDSVQNEKSKPEAERELRKAKEEFYSTGNPLEPICVIERTETKGKKLIPVDLDAAKLDEIVNERVISFADDNNEARVGSWSDLCEEFFQYAKEQIGSMSVDGKPCPIGTIAITGGASKMPFIKDLCERVFPDCEIHLERNPSYSVSNGLCWAYLGEEQLEDCITEAMKELKNNDALKIDTLIDDITDLVFDPVMNLIANNSHAWAAPGNKCSVRDLIDSISFDLNSPSEKKRFADIIRQANANWENACGAAIHEAVLKQAKKLYCNNLPLSATAVNGKVLRQFDLVFDSVVDAICSRLIAIIKTVVLMIVIIIIGGLLLPFYPIGSALGALLIMNAYNIAAGINVPPAGYNQNLADFIRRGIANNINNPTARNKANIAQKLHDAIDEQVRNDFDEAEFEKDLKQTVRDAMRIMLLIKFD